MHVVVSVTSLFLHRWHGLLHFVYILGILLLRRYCLVCYFGYRNEAMTFVTIFIVVKEGVK